MNPPARSENDAHSTRLMPRPVILVAALVLSTLLPHSCSAASWDDCMNAVASGAAFDITRFGATDDGISSATANTAAIALAVQAASHTATTSYVFVPEGTFVVGSFNLSSDVYLCLDDGSELYGSNNASDYKAVISITSDTGPFDFPLVFLYDVVRSGIFGSGNPIASSRGRINGGLNSPPGNHISSYDAKLNFLLPEEWPLPGCTPFSCRPKLLVARLSQHLVFQGFDVVNSALWTMTLSESTFILIDHMLISGSRQYPNNDGIDCISCVNLAVTNTNISTGDDCVAIISHSATPLSNVTLSNLRLQSSSAAIKLAAFDLSATGGVHGITVTNITVTDTNRGICVDPRWGSGSITNATFTDMTIETHYFSSAWWGEAEPLYITATSASAEHVWNGSVSHITFERIHMHSENGIFFYSNTSQGLPLMTGIAMIDTHVLVDRWSNISSPSHDYRPSQPPQIVRSMVWGLYVDGAASLLLTKSSIAFAATPQAFYANCVEVVNSSSVDEHEVTCTPPATPI